MFFKPLHSLQAVRLESMYEERIRYIILVSCNGIQDTEESIILGVDIMSNSATIGLVLPIWCETSTQLDGDGYVLRFFFPLLFLESVMFALSLNVVQDRRHMPYGLSFVPCFQPDFTLWSGISNSQLRLCGVCATTHYRVKLCAPLQLLCTRPTACRTLIMIRLLTNRDTQTQCTLISVHFLFVRSQV